MFVRSPLNAWHRQSRILLSLGHRARLGDGLCISDPDRDGLWLCDQRSRAGTAAGRPPRAWAGFLAGRRRRRDGDGPGVARARVGALHFLSADDRQSLLLHRRCAGRRRLMDLGRADVDQYARSGSARIRDKPVPLAMFANVAGAYLWGWTAVGAALEIIFQILPGRARPEIDDRRRAGARVLLLDAACDRLFLAVPDLYRLLHDLPARDRRPALQRHDGADCLHPVSGLRDADRHASSVRRSAGRRRIQVHPFGLHRRWWRCRRC